MSNWLDYHLDVLATNPAEINLIQDRLQRPSAELVSWAAEQFHKPGESLTHISAQLADLLNFKPVTNLGSIHPSVNKARRFTNTLTDRAEGIAQRHLVEVSLEFPSVIFLLTYRDPHSYSGKVVIRGGTLVAEIRDDNQRAQDHDWVLLDIFAPFIAEYDTNSAFGSLWQECLHDVSVQVEELKKRSVESSEIDSASDQLPQV